MRVIIADDHPLVRNGIRLALAGREDIEVVAEAATGDETLSAVLEYRPDLLILDVCMPGLACEQILLQASASFPHLKTLILTAYDDDVYVRRLSRVAIRGFLLKDEAPENLLQAIRVIEGGAVWFSQSVAQKMMGLVAHPEHDEYSLTQRERAVLALIARGEDNRAIALKLGLAEQTVRNYVTTLYDKIQVTSRAMAIVWARERDIQA